MKTLNQEAQNVILSDAGSTYRNVLLALGKEYKLDGDAIEVATLATQKFIDLAVKNMKVDSTAMQIGELSNISANIGACEVRRVRVSDAAGNSVLV